MTLEICGLEAIVLPGVHLPGAALLGALARPPATADHAIQAPVNWLNLGDPNFNF
jgi:hypothetical protein